MNESDLHKYQNNAVSHIIKNKFCALFMEMGLGKTVSSLTAANILMYEDLEITRTLVIGPKRVVESVWHAECEKWDHLKHLKTTKIIGSAKQRRQALQENSDIYLISRDNIAWLCGQYGGSMLPFDMLIIDELSSFKNPKSIRFKALRNVQPCFKRIIGLTGTPAPNGLIDLWSQIYLLDRGERLGRFITKFREEYFTAGKSNGNIVYRYDITKENEKILHEKIGDICMSMKAKDYLNLPKRIDNVIRIPLPDDIKKKYDDFEKEKVLEIFEEQQILGLETGITAVNAAALSNKLLQFANGAVYDESKNYHEVHNLKIDAVKEIIEDANGSPVLIAWTYRHDMYRLREALKKYKPRELKGDQDILDWNSGKIRVMMMHPASGGHGLNLQAGGNIVVWFGQTWSLELYQQLNARLDRQGQKNAVIVHRLAIDKTIDIDVIKAISRKAKGQDGLMEAVKSRIKKYLK